MFQRRIGFLLQRYVQFHPVLYGSLSTAVNTRQPTASIDTKTDLWTTIKSNAKLISSATPEDMKHAFNTINELGYAHLNEEDMTQKAKSNPFPITSTQALAAIRQILNSSTLEEPTEVAKEFAMMLVDLKLTKLDDTWIRVLMQAVVERYPIKGAKLLDMYTSLSRLQPFPKVYLASAFILLRELEKRGEKHELYKKALNVIEQQGSKLPRVCIEGAVLLLNDRALEFLDRLKNNDHSLGIDELRYLCKIASVTNEPKILEPLVQLNYILPKHHEICLELYNTLAILYGKKSDLDGINVLWRSLSKQIKYHDLPHYKHVFRRCRHFYRCNNQKTPDDLFLLLQKLGD